MASGGGSSPRTRAAIASPHRGTVARRGALRAAPMRCWLTLRKVQPRKKCSAPARTKLMVAQAFSSSILSSSPDAAQMAMSTAVATIS